MDVDAADDCALSWLAVVADGVTVDLPPYHIEMVQSYLGYILLIPLVIPGLLAGWPIGSGKAGEGDRTQAEPHSTLVGAGKGQRRLSAFLIMCTDVG